MEDLIFEDNPMAESELDALNRYLIDHHGNRLTIHREPFVRLLSEHAAMRVYLKRMNIQPRAREEGEL